MDTARAAPVDLHIKIDQLNDQAWGLLHADPARCRALAEEAERLASGGAADVYLPGLAYSLLIQSILDWDRSDYGAALTRALQALAGFEKIGNLRQQAYTLNHIATIHYFLGNTPQAFELGLTAVDLAEQSGDKSLLASLLNDTGYIRLHLEDPRKALPQLFRSLELHEVTGMLQGKAQALDSLGKAFYLIGDYTQALLYEQQSLALDRATGYKRAEAEALGNIGKIYARLGDSEQALAYFNQSLALSREGDYKQFEASTLLDVGRLHLARNDPARALDALRQALAVAEAIQSKLVQYEIHATLSQGYKHTGDYQKALHHFERFHTLKEEVFDEKNNFRLLSLQALHETEKARQETEIYQLRNVALQQEIQEREKLIAELDAFAHSVAHDLKNPLAVLIGMGEMIHERLLAGELNEQVLQMVREMLSRGYKTSRIVDELLMLATVRRRDVTPHPLDMAAIVADTEVRLAGQIASSGAQVIKPDTWPAALGYAPWIEEVWANYISNAIKYGGAPPRVELGATPAGDQVRFWVRDNGPGISPADQAKLFTEFTRLSTDYVGGHGLGLSIVKRIMEKLGGSVAVESAGQSGSTFSFSLPAAPPNP